jgi:serine/threonine-protein kinase HipA
MAPQIVQGERSVEYAHMLHWLDNLLPEDNSFRALLARQFNLPSHNVASLLSALGQDCAGDIEVRSVEATRQNDGIGESALSDSEVEKLLLNLTKNAAWNWTLPFPRVALSGAQRKTALLWQDGQWHLPQGRMPTTHIFKSPVGLIGPRHADMSSSVQNEWLCSQILLALGFRVAASKMVRFGSMEVLVVERFDRDRNRSDSAITRLAQEDFCQALGIPAGRKYENEGGPGISAALNLLSGSSDASQDKLHFLMAQLAFWLLAACDGHAKNFSIFLHDDGSYRATPLYDVLSYWPILGDGPNQIPYRKARLAMALRGTSPHYHLHQIQRRHWQALAARSGVPNAFDLMVRLAESVPIALDQVEARLPTGFPAKVWRTVRAGTLRHARAFLAA